MMLRALAVAALAALICLGIAAPRAAALVDLAAVAAADVAIEEGAPVSDAARARLENSAAELRAAGTPVKYVVLAARPDDPLGYARSVREGLSFRGDVLVLSAEAGNRNLAIASPLPTGTVEGVYRSRIDALRADPIAGTIAVGVTLAGMRGSGGGAGAAPGRDGGSGGGGAAGIVLPLILLVGGGALLVGRLRGRGRAREEAARSLADDAASLEPLVDALATRIADLEDDIRTAGERAAAAGPHHEVAVLAYGDAREALAAPQPTREGVRAAGEALERGLRGARRAQAVLEGRPPEAADEEPLLEGLCAFDPKHGRAVTTVAITTPGGDTAELPACARCAAQMAAGEEPRFREVYDHGRPVPYWQSRGMGGMAGGFGGPLLGGALAGLVLGGMLSPGPADAADPGGWGGGDFGDSGGGFGGGFGGGDFGGGGGGGDF